jgi:hypothetical protein
MFRGDAPDENPRTAGSAKMDVKTLVTSVAPSVSRRNWIVTVSPTLIDVADGVPRKTLTALALDAPKSTSATVRVLIVNSRIIFLRIYFWLRLGQRPDSH